MKAFATLVLLGSLGLGGCQFIGGGVSHVSGVTMTFGGGGGGFCGGGGGSGGLGGVVVRTSLKLFS